MTLYPTKEQKHESALSSLQLALDLCRIALDCAEQRLTAVGTILHVLDGEGLEDAALRTRVERDAARGALLQVRRERQLGYETSARLRSELDDALARLAAAEDRLLTVGPPVQTVAVADTGDHDDVCTVCHHAVDEHTWEDCARGLGRDLEAPCQGCAYLGKRNQELETELAAYQRGEHLIASLPESERAQVWRELNQAAGDHLRILELTRERDALQAELEARDRGQAEPPLPLSGSIGTGKEDGTAPR
jgi:hypothetical protein